MVRSRTSRKLLFGVACKAFTAAAPDHHMRCRGMSETTMRKRHKTYDEIRLARIAERREQALAALHCADQIARSAGCRLMVFGSLVEGGFDEQSDIDVAVFGEPASSDGDPAVQIETALSLAGFSADVIPERFLPPSLRKRILDHGCEPSALGRRQT